MFLAGTVFGFWYANKQSKSAIADALEQVNDMKTMAKEANDLIHQATNL